MVTLPPRDQWPDWLQHAVKDVGVSEVPGMESHPRILEYYAHTALKNPKQRDDSSTSWCASAMSCWLDECGYESPHAAMARSFLGYGRKIDVPTFGCIAVFWTGQPVGTAGHVGFYCGEAARGHMTVFGGNQGNRVCFNSITYTRQRVLGYRLPVRPVG